MKKGLSLTTELAITGLTFPEGKVGVVQESVLAGIDSEPQLKGVQGPKPTGKWLLLPLYAAPPLKVEVLSR